MIEEGSKCSCGDGSPRLIIYSCSGSSNVGQLANEAAVEMVSSGKGSMGCLVGLSAHVSIMLQNAKAADRVLMIDGCGVACGRKALEHVGITDFDSVVITDMGVKKGRDPKGDRDRLPEILERISGMTATIAPKVIGDEQIKVGCGCGTGGCCSDDK